jgi:hypothetical protein
MRLLPTVGSVLLFVALAGCFFGPTPQEDVTSRPDHFELREYLTHRSEVAEHAWVNTGETAHVDVEANAGPGSVKVIVLDANRTEVYSQTFAGETSSRAVDTGRGVPGTWTVRLVYQDAVGNINVSADAVKGGEET